MSRFYRNLKENGGKASLSVVLTVSLITGVFALYMSTPAQADALTSVSDTLSSSAPDAASNHTILFVTPTGIGDTADTTITVQLTGFTLGILDFNDIDLAVDDDAACDGTFTDRTLAATNGTDQWGVATSSDTITFSSPDAGSGEGIVAGRCVQIEIGTNATGGGGNNQVVNPSKVAAEGTADTPTIAIAGGFGDSGDALVAIIEGVTVSVTVDETLAFTIAGVASGSCTGDTGDLADTANPVTTTATTVPYGTAGEPNEFYVGCQTLTVNTNAGSGYAVTGEVDTSLQFHFCTCGSCGSKD